jgi:RNA-directed DNA polymerase
MQKSKTEEQVKELSMREAMLPAKVREWRAKLSAKAKQQKRFRFYSLYGLIHHAETLQAAWQQVRANAGAPGVDGVSIGQIEAQGLQDWLEQLGQELRNKTYRCQWVRRVYIPKANGKLRPLGIPTIGDRVVQCATLLILEPILEADFEECSYGFRPQRNAHQALEKIRQHLRAGKCEIYDADLEGYFDSIPHEKLMGRALLTRNFAHFREDFSRRGRGGTRRKQNLNPKPCVTQRPLCEIHIILLISRCGCGLAALSPAV